jgi:LysM repeat protein
LEEVRKPKAGELFWSGRERRWVYARRKGETMASIARKLVMQTADILAMNNALRENQLPDPMRFYVSPRDNGPLTHIILRSDTLEKLAKIYDTDVPRLRVRNDLGADDKLVLGRRFLIREKAIDDRLARTAVPKPKKIDDSQLSMARQPYARLGQFSDKQKAMRGTREFYAKYYEFMDSDISLRRERDDAQKGKTFYNMDIGPLRSERHGEAYCALFRKDEMPCIVVYRVPGSERARNFDSQAIISVSPYVYFDGEDELDSGRTDVPRLTKLEYFLTEGQELGNADGTIAKITNDRIMLTDANGYLLTLPLNYVPEIDPEEKRRAAEAARQAAMQKAALAAGAAAEAAGNVDVDVPGPEDTALGKRLQGNEATRREGSQGFIKALAEKPKKLDEK